MNVKAFIHNTFRNLE